MIRIVSLLAVIVGCIALSGCTHSPYVYNSGGPRVVDEDAQFLDEEVENVENIRDRPMRGYTPSGY